MLSFLGIASAFGPWGLLIGAAIGAVIYYLSRLSTMSTSTKQNMLVIFAALAAGLIAVMAFIGSAFFLPFIALLGGLLIATSMSIEGYKLSWQGFKDYLKDTWVGIAIIAQETWNAIIGWLKAKFDAFVGWISGRVGDVMSAVSRAIQAVASLPSAAISGAVNAARSVGATISGARAAGGYVGAGSSYIVGERGPEIFTPRLAGAIAPNGGGSGILVDMRGSTFLDRQAAVEIGDEIIRRLKELHRIGRL